MPHDKPGPKEQELRAMREARIAANKAQIDKNVKEIGSVFKVKGKMPKSVKTVVQFKTKRGRTGR